jgi:hypothetical protein
MCIFVVRNSHLVVLHCMLELVPTLMIDDAETKMRTDAAVLFELKTLVLFFHTLQICELIYVAVYLATGL